MIGIISNPTDNDVVCEFFELFKTPWEFYRDKHEYDVVLCSTGQTAVSCTAKLVVLYSGQALSIDTVNTAGSAERKCKRVLIYRERRIPLYGNSVLFRENEDAFVSDELSGHTVAYRMRSNEGNVVRFGYDLFEEIRTFLTQGQPQENAAIPALDLHISLLRDTIVASGIPLAEIPPIPAEYRSIACLTHDLDHPRIRLHSWDRTTMGFLYRATVGSLMNLLRGRISLRDLITNWLAAVKLPLVYVGLAQDFWRCSIDHYLKLEEGLSSTFFVIPFKHTPGKEARGTAPAPRASAYGARDIADTICAITSAGCEVGLHGIDAWLDSARGKEELNEIRGLTDATEIGVRMHWLYYDQASPAILEQAGVSYDSSMGYRETAGYRAGTTQAYKPLQTERLLELPLHAMDTALFYPAYMGLSFQQADRVLQKFTDDLFEFGGCMTVNWHDRSLAPERLWYASYRRLIENLKAQGAWFATADQAVSWFRKRRSVVFDTDNIDPEQVSARITSQHNDQLPGLRFRVHKPKSECVDPDSEGFVDISFNRSVVALSSCDARS